MAKVVIAGRSDCPYFARAELLGDRLAKNLPSFQLHKIVKTPDEWQNWVNDTCRERNWNHKQSPMVWRELIDRGGKGVLIGGASDFQEYVKGYYGLETPLTSEDVKKISSENTKTKNEIDQETSYYKALSKPMHVCITAADSPVCYAVLACLASGEVFGANTELNIRLYDDASANFQRIAGVAMEAQDLCEGLVRGIEVEKDLSKVFQDASVIILLDELLKEEEETTESWLVKNHALFTAYGQAINECAKKNVRVLVTGNGPVNTNTMALVASAPKIARQNIVALSRGVENRAKAVIGQRLNVNTAGVVNLIVWGNINGKHFIDNSKSRVHGYDGAVWGPPFYSVPVLEMVHDSKWMEKEYLEQVEQRRSAVETALGHSSSGSTARAIASMLTHWWNGSPQGQMFSLGVSSEGWYGVPEDMVFSFPVTLSPKGYWTVVQDIELPDETKQKLKECVQDLVAEREAIFPPPKPPTPEVEETTEEADAAAGSEEPAAETDPNSTQPTDEPLMSDATQSEAEAQSSEAEAAKPEAEAEVEKPEAEATGN